jgi:hypothetical protein
VLVLSLSESGPNAPACRALEEPPCRETMRTVILHQNLFMGAIAAAVLGGWLILA